MSFISKVLVTTVITLSVQLGFADQSPTTLGLIFGQSSIPAADSDVLINSSSAMPSRAPGGEMISIMLPTIKNMDEIILQNFSNSGQGKVLIHEARVILADGTQVPIGEPETMLSVNLVLQVPINQPIKSVMLHVEGYSSNDATLVAELISTDGWYSGDYHIGRTLTPASNNNGHNDNNGINGGEIIGHIIGDIFNGWHHHGEGHDNGDGWNNGGDHGHNGGHGGHWGGGDHGHDNGGGWNNGGDHGHNGGHGGHWGGGDHGHDNGGGWNNGGDHGHNGGHGGH